MVFIRVTWCNNLRLDNSVILLTGDCEVMASGFCFSKSSQMFDRFPLKLSHVVSWHYMYIQCGLVRPTVWFCVSVSFRFASVWKVTRKIFLIWQILYLCESATQSNWFCFYVILVEKVASLWVYSFYVLFCLKTGRCVIERDFAWFLFERNNRCCDQNALNSTVKKCVFPK